MSFAQRESPPGARKRKGSKAKKECVSTSSASPTESAFIPQSMQSPRSGSIPDAVEPTSIPGAVQPNIPTPRENELIPDLQTPTPPLSPLDTLPSPPDSPDSPSQGGLGVTWFHRNAKRPPWVYQVDLNLLWWAIMAAAFVVRFWRLNYPCYVVFDEVHFGKFASYYLQRTFYFDVHPPLGKLLFAFVGYLGGFDGQYLFPSIGSEYPATVPYVTMRGLSAITGVLVVACVYEIMTELGFTHKTAALATFFTAFDNSLVVQSRVIMLDSLLIFLTLSSILAYLKFHHHRTRPFSRGWHRSLALTGFSLGCLVGVKYTGLLGMGCVGLLALWDLWQLVGNHALSIWVLCQHTALRGLYLVGIPFLVNVVLFYIHFLLLSQAGPGNPFVSPAFRNSLEGSIDLAPTVQLSPNATLLRYGSYVSLRSAELSCWLHSHNHTYPLKYPDGRGSSFQQQVTCYDFKDVNNYWALRKPGSPGNSSVPVDSSPVRNGDLVELVHLGTGKLLNSHDVAAPLSPSHQEVAGYINYSAQFVPYLHWMVDVAGVGAKELVFWERGKLKMRLLHVHSKQVLSCSGKRLPEWGFQQYEVVTDKTIVGPHVLWGIDDLRTPNHSQQAGNHSHEEEEREIKESLLRHAQPAGEGGDGGGATLSFWDKYLEIQEHMVYAHSNLGDHTFGAPPQTWPLMGKTLPYWLDEKSNAQVTLLGNPVLWWISTCSIHVFGFLTTLYLMRRRRMKFDIGQEEFHHWWTSGSALVLGWFLHYSPYFLFSRVLFLHHYLPALPFKFMLLAAVCQHLQLWAIRLSCYVPPVPRLFDAALSLLLVAVVISYIIFAPFTYGFPALTLEQMTWRAWVGTWDLLHR